MKERKKETISGYRLGTDYLSQLSRKCSNTRKRHLGSKIAHVRNCLEHKKNSEQERKKESKTDLNILARSWGTGFNIFLGIRIWNHTAVEKLWLNQLYKVLTH